MKRKLSHRHMSTFLTSSDNVSKIMNTVVMEEVDKVSKSLMSSRNIFKLRSLKPKRGKDTLKDCYIYEDEAEIILAQIIEIFDLQKYIGSTNSKQIMDWVLKVLKFQECQQLPNFVYKEALFARAFRAKKVMSDEDPNSKRRSQTTIVDNVQGAICWWLLAAFRQVAIPIEVQNKTSYMWRKRYLVVLKREMKDFRARYLPKRLIPELCSTPVTSHIGPLKFSVVGNKLRPIFRKTRAERYKEAMKWKQTNSILTWCLEKKGIFRPTIKQSCHVISKFLAKNSGFPQIFGYTVDISKCFSTVMHQNLICIIERLLQKRCEIWSIYGKGVDNKGYTKLLFIARNSQEEAKSELAKRMKHKKVSNYSIVFCRSVSSKWLLDELRSKIASYFYKRGKATFKITKGVPQGHPLSSLLSTLYLSDFEEEHWTDYEFDPRVVYCRYEDDYLFITTDKGVFGKMTKPLFDLKKNGHSLKANRQKCQDSSQTLFWCGVKINLEKSEFAVKKRCSDGKVRRIPMKFQ